MFTKCYVIAEAGVNHNGDIELAKRLIEAAAEIGADAVKFQTFVAERLVSKSGLLAPYQKRTQSKYDSQLELLKSLELTQDEHFELFQYSKKFKIDYLSTAFDLESLVFVDGLGVRLHKVPSGEITNYPLLQLMSKLKKPVIISTGMATLAEIEAAVSVLLDNGLSKADLTILHCTTAYPAPFESINLKAMIGLSEKFKMKVGYSDHTVGNEVAFASVALGASVIEKHLTLDKRMEGPDHGASTEPAEFLNLIRGIRNLEIALGSSEKVESEWESPNKNIVRKSIVAAREIELNELFTIENLTTKRPGDGMSPMKWTEMLGKRSRCSYKIDDQIRE